MSDSETKPKTASTEEVVTKFILGITENKICPAAIKPLVEKAAPILGKIVQSVENSVPFFINLYKELVLLWEQYKEYRLELLLPTFVGIIMCFFGGSFLTLIAAVEAFYMYNGLENMKECATMIYEDVQKIVDANAKDNSKDADGDGVPDVLQMATNGQLLQRKFFLFLSNLDPTRFNKAVMGINAGFLAIIATLKMQFVKSITLSNSICAQILVPINHFVVPKIEEHTPQEYKKWIKPAVYYICYSVAISLAWFVSRLIASFHSAIRGGLMASRNLLRYLSEMKIYHINHEETYLDEALGYALAAVGLFFQLRFGFGLPFPLNIFLFPIRIAEYVLVWLVSN